METGRINPANTGQGEAVARQSSSAAASPGQRATTASALGQPASNVMIEGSNTQIQVDFSSQTTFSEVNNRVNAMLGQIDPALIGNELLKMVITLLILDVLLGKDGDKEGLGAMLLALLAGGDPQDLSVLNYSETTSTHIQYSSGGYHAMSTQNNPDASTGSLLDTRV